MLTAKVTQSNGHVVHVRLVQSDSATDTTVAGAVSYTHLTLPTKA